MMPSSRVRRDENGGFVGPCPSCGESPVILFLKAKNTDKPEQYRITEEQLRTCWDLWKCARCGFIFSDWQLSEAELEALYKNMKDAVYDSEDVSRRLTFRHDLKRITQHLRTHPVSLLDVGCATGLFLVEAKELGWQVAGIDVSSWAIRRTKERGITDAHEGTVFSFPGKPGNFDVVTLLDYIEHDPDPGKLLDRIHVLLKPHGLLYITTPDIGGITARIFGARWWGINPLHLTYFSRAPMRRLLERHGFEVLRLRSYRRTFTLGYWASRLTHFSPGFSKKLEAVLRFFHLSSLPFSITLFDAMEVIARKQS